MSYANEDRFFDIQATGLFRAQAILGGVSKLGKCMGVSRQYAYAALQKGYLPLPRAKQVSAATGVPVKELIDPKMRAAVEQG